MEASGRQQRQFEPRTGSVVSGESATGNGLVPPTAPLPLNLLRRRRIGPSHPEGQYPWATTITL
jgi:hypothetical protein